MKQTQILNQKEKGIIKNPSPKNFNLHYDLIATVSI